MEPVCCSTPVMRVIADAAAGGAPHATPSPCGKNLPEAISLTCTPGRVFSSDVSATEDVDGVVDVSPFSSTTPSLASAACYAANQEVGITPKEAVHRAGGKKRESPARRVLRPRNEEQVGATASLPPESRRGSTPVVEGTPVPSTSSESASPPRTVGSLHRLSAPIPSAMKHRAQLAEPKMSSDREAALTMSSFKPLHGDLARPSSGLFSLRTTSGATTHTSTCNSKQLSPPERKKNAPQNEDRSDMSSRARSHPHLSVLVDLLDHKPFTEEAVLLELEAIRKRSLLTTAPFNKHLLPILARYLLRDKFGEEAAAHYVSFLTCPPGTPRPDGAVNTTNHIASFLPRVNEIRRERRRMKEEVRRSPTHHYTITPPRSPKEAGAVSITTTSSERRPNWQRRCTPTYDALEDASDIPSTWASSSRSPTSCSKSFSPQLPSPLPRDRLHLYTQEQLLVDRKQAKAEDRTIVDVVVDPTETKARAKNVYAVVEASTNCSTLQEPSILQPPPPFPAEKGTAAGKLKKSEKAIPEPLCEARVTSALEDATSAHLSQESDVLRQLSSISPVSTAGMMANDYQSTFYHDAPQKPLSSASHVSKPAKSAHRGDHEGNGLRGRQHDVSVVVVGGTLNLSDIPCGLDPSSSAQEGLRHDETGASTGFLSSYLEELATGTAANDGVSGGSKKQRLLDTVKPVKTKKRRPLHSSAVDDSHSSVLRNQRGDAEYRTAAPHSSTTESYLVRPAKRKQAANKTDSEVGLANLHRQHSPLDLSASCTVATNAGYYSTLPDASMITQKPASLPASPSVDRKRHGKREIRELRRHTTPQDAPRDATQTYPSYGSLLPGGSTMLARTVGTLDVSRVTEARAEYSAFDSTVASQLPSPSLFVSENTSFLATKGEMSAAVFSMFQQDNSSTSHPAVRGNKRNTTSSPARGPGAAESQDGGPYSAFHSAQESAKMSPPTQSPEISVFASETTANAMEDPTPTLHEDPAESSAYSALATNSSSGGLSNGMSPPVYRTHKRSPLTRASPPPNNGELSQQPHRGDTSYGSFIRSSPTRLSPVPPDGRDTQSSTRLQCASTIPTSRSLSEHFRASLLQNSSSRDRGTSANHSSLVDASGTVNTAADRSSVMGGASHGGYSALGDRSSVQQSSLGGGDRGYGSLVDASGTVNAAADRSSVMGGASHGGYSALGDRSSVQQSSLGGGDRGYGSLVDASGTVNAAADRSSVMGGASHGGYSVLESMTPALSSCNDGTSDSSQEAGFDAVVWRKSAASVGSLKVRQSFSNDDSGTEASAMDALQLQALMRRLERPVSGLRENKACTFGEEGCRCALGGCLLHSVLVKSTLVEGTPEKTGECSFLGVDDSAVQASTLCGPLEAGMPEEGQISPSPTAPLQQQDVNALSVLHKKVEKKRCALPLKVSPRVEGTPIRQGTGFNTRKSPQPSRGNRAFGGSETPANDAESLMVTVAGSTLPTYRRENTYAGEPAPLDGDAHASHVTIISNPCSSSEVSLHNVPDLCNRLAEACTSVPQPKKQWQQDANPKGPCLADCPRECALVPPVSILNSSTAGTGRLSESRSPPPAAAINAVAPSVKGSARSAANGVSMVGGLSIIVGQGLMQTPASGCQGDANVGEELAASLLMPHDMTNVLFNGRPRRRVGAAGNVSVVEPTSDVGTPTRTRDDTRTEWELCPEVHAKHPNLATILASSRLDGSNIIEGQTPIVDRRTLLPSSDLSHTLGATSVCSKVHNPTAQQSPVSYSRSKASSGSVCSWSSGSLRPSSALAGHGTTSTTVTLQDTHQQATSPEAPQDMSSQMKAAVPRRCLLMQPQPTAPETALERELRQRQHTILDVPGVPYVDSPDISTHIDRTEARVKERKHQEFIIRWAQRGLIWQQQERAAQMRDEHFAKMRGVPEMPDPPSPRAMRETSPYRGAAPHKPQPQLKVPASSRPRPPPMHGLPPKNPQRRGL